MNKNKENRIKESPLVLHAKRELEMLEELCKDEKSLEHQKLINESILELVKTFSNQGHSGFSANYTKDILYELLSSKPLRPLTGEDDEWEDISYKRNNLQQNKRCSAVFRENGDNATAKYLYGKIFTEDDGKTWFTGKDSSVKVTFPYHVPGKPEEVYLETKSAKIMGE